MCINGHERNSYHTILNSLENNMTINLNVFGPLMKHKIRCNVNGSLVVTIHTHRSLNHKHQLLQEVLQPQKLTRIISHSSVLNLRTRPRNYCLLLTLPGDKIAT